jgi:hypothetical protein
MRKLLLGTTIYTIAPIEGDMLQVKVVMNFGTEAHGSIRVLS